jgi:hypothetical protein
MLIPPHLNAWNVSLLFALEIVDVVLDATRALEVRVRGHALRGEERPAHPFACARRSHAHAIRVVAVEDRVNR